MVSSSSLTSSVEDRPVNLVNTFSVSMTRQNCCTFNGFATVSEVACYRVSHD